MQLTIENINTAKTLAVAIKRHRKHAGMTQKELADVVSMRQATISDLENGRGTLDSFFKVIQVLKLNVVLSTEGSLKVNDLNSNSNKILDLLDD